MEWWNPYSRLGKIRQNRERVGTGQRSRFLFARQIPHGKGFALVYSASSNFPPHRASFSHQTYDARHPLFSLGGLRTGSFGWGDYIAKDMGQR